MSALPYQPVPTATQRRELERLLASDRAKRYADVQAIKRAESAARDACCDVTDEPPVTLAEGISIIAKGFACIAGWLAFGFGVLWLCDLAGQFFGSNV